jgi:prolyl 4-hydroxylase
MMQTENIDQDWKVWVDHNLQRGCNAMQICTTLLKNGFGLSDVETMMGRHFPKVSSMEVAQQRSAAAEPMDYHKLSKTRITRTDSGEQVAKIVTDKAQIFTLNNFLTQEECEKVIQISETLLKPSAIKGSNRDDFFRTSETCYLNLLGDECIKQIDDKIAYMLGIRASYSEGIQAQKYSVGQGFKAHTDYFDPNTTLFEKHDVKLGQRTWTFMVYLSDVEEGGETYFPRIDKIFYPQRGQAIIWNNLYEDGSPNRDTLHQSMSVIKGTKFIITKWFRDKGFGPVFC